jgi:hypothetical protein
MSGDAMRLMRRTIPALLLAGLLNCGGDGGPKGGELDVRLTTPNGDDGAVLLTLTGGRVDAQQAPGYTVYSATVAGERRIVVAGRIASGVLLRVQVPDLRQAADYVVTLNQVARRGSYESRPLGGYTLVIVQP